MDVSWKTVAIVVAGIAAIVTTVLVGPVVGLSEETIAAVVSAQGLIGIVVAGAAKQLLVPRPDPRRRARGSLPPSGPLALALAVAIGGSTTACGSSALSTHARAATVGIATLQTAGTILDDARDRDLDGVERVHPVRGPERDAALDAAHARWQPIGVALDNARAGLAAWVDAIDLARAADAGDALLPRLLALAVRFTELYAAIARAAALTGARLPELPELPAFGGAR